MKQTTLWLWAGGLLSIAVATALITAADRPLTVPAVKPATNPPATNMNDKVVKSDAEWKKTLTPEQYQILREKGTEQAFTGKYWNHKETGAYRCAGCGEELFTSSTKFDSGCGWPSFYAPSATNRVVEKADTSHGMTRVEVLCAKCGGHLGHVFEDGPRDKTGLRYCINSGSIEFAKPVSPTAPPPTGTGAK